MSDPAHYIELLTVLVLAIFVGFEVISKVPTTLHTPLMSATNAIHGIVLAGAIVIVARLFSGSVSAGLGGAGNRGGHARRDQRLRRLRGDGAHASNVQTQGSPGSDRHGYWNFARRPLGDRFLHLRSARAELARHGPPRQSLCDDRHGSSRSPRSSFRPTPSAGGRSRSASPSARSSESMRRSKSR